MSWARGMMTSSSPGGGAGPSGSVASRADMGGLLRLCAPCALLKASRGQPEQHQVVGEDPQDELARLGGGAAGREGGAEAALVLAEAALRVPALMVQRAREAAAHRA